MPTSLELSNFKYICIQKNVAKARGLALSLIIDVEGLFDFIIECFEIEETIKIRGDEELINNIGSTFNDKMNETFLGMITDIKCKNDNEETINFYNISINYLFLFDFKIYTLCENTTKSDKDNYFEGTYDFNDFLKENLTEEKLINSERIIERKEMEKIFIDILTEKDASYIPEFLKKILDKLNVYFLDKYYKKKKIIKRKDLYKLINMEEISTNI